MPERYERKEASRKFARRLSRFSETVLDSAIESAVPGIAISANTSDLLIHALTVLLSSLSWIGVRIVGSLQILTKASYFSLVFVPLIAGVWPFIRNALNEYNDTITRASEISLDAADKLDSRLQQLANAGESHAISQALVAAELQKVTATLREISENYTYLLHDIHMPSSLAFAFFAALAVAIGHLIFQAFCPQSVKIYSQSEFVNKSIQDFVENPSSLKLKTYAEVFSDRYQVEVEALINTVVAGRVSAITLLEQSTSDEGKSSLTEFLRQENDDPMIAEAENLRLDRSKELVEAAAHFEYAGKVVENIGWALFSLVLYLIGALLIILIIIIQVSNVVRAAGWM